MRLTPDPELALLRAATLTLSAHVLAQLAQRRAALAQLATVSVAVATSVEQQQVAQ